MRYVGKSPLCVALDREMYVLSSVLVAPRNALVARGEALLAAPGTCETAMHGSTDTAGGRGAELLKVTYPNGGAGK